MKYRIWKRALCCLLSMILILGNIPVFSFAEESDGLCEHHTVHTSECGYSPAIPGSPCTHEHTQDCYQTVAECIHVHDDACGYNEEVGDASCAHVCSEEYGCFKLVPDCRHAHDGSCGYVEATPEQPCTYSCTECAEPGEAPSESEEDPSEPEVDEAVEAVRALIEALPTLEEIKAMSTQEQSEVYTQVQKAYDAYDALTDDQKAQLPGAEEIFTSLFEYFNSLTAPTSDVLASGTCGYSLTWELTDDGVLTISGTGEMVSYDSQYDTPWYGYLSDIQEIVIEDGITSIGDYAFGCVTYPNVSSVTVPKSVTKLGLYAFGGNKIQVRYAGTMTEWMSINFYYAEDFWSAPGAVCSDGTILTLGFCGKYGVSGSPRYVLTGDGCMRIYGTGDMQFNKNLTNRSHWSTYNSSITSVVVEDGVTSIADYSFDGCKNLTTVTLPDNLRSIGTYAFRSCTALKAIDIPSSVMYLGSGVFQSSGLESIEIPEGVKYIKDYSFLNCSALSSVTIPSSVTDIGGQAFYGCSVLTDIYYGSDEQAWNQITIAANNNSLSSATIHYTNPCAEGHTEETIPGKAATCTESGLTDGKKCSVCGEILEEQQVIPAGHNFVDGVCSGCGAITGNCGAEGDNLTYLLTTDGKLTISGSGKMADYSDRSSAPWYSERKKITSVVLTDGVTSIGDYAFYACIKLSSVTIPDGVSSIGKYAFSCCSSLTSVTIPDSVSSIGRNAFEGCSSLTSVTIPDGVSSIGSHAFYGCSSLTSVTIPDGVSSIEDSTFNGCSSLTSVTIPDGVSSIGYYAFYGCSGLTSVTIPDGVSSIGNYAFCGCSGLTSVTIPEGVTSIGSAAFKNCTGLTTVQFLGNGFTGTADIFNNAVTAYYPHRNTTWTQEIRDSFGSYVTWVEPCTNGTTHTEAIDPAVEPTCTKTGLTEGKHCSVCGTVLVAQKEIPTTSHTEETIPGKAATCTEDGLTNGKKCSVCGEILEEPQTIPAGHTFVNGVCSGCGAITGSCGANGYNLTYLLTTDGVLTISGSGKMEDYWESSLAPWYSERAKITSVVLPNGVTSIGRYAFGGCSGLTSVTIPDSVSSIGSHAFHGCSGLTSVTIPDGVSSIGEYAFSYCSSLISVTIPDGVSSIGEYAFYGSIGEYAFTECSSLTSVTIPDGVSSIGEYAFSYCSSLISVTIPDGVSSIGRNAFDGCSSLTSVTIPDGVTSIKTQTFSGCSGLTSVTIPDGVTSIESNAFSGCSSLTSVTIPDSVSSIEGGTFFGCSSLTDLTIPDGVSSIGNSTFHGCSSLTDLTIPDGVTSIGSFAFYGCSSLTDLTIPDGVSSIESSTFRGCSGLTSVTIPDGVSSIGGAAFYGCSSLTDLTIPDGVSSIGSSAFRDCSSLTSVTIPDGVSSIESSTFRGCSGLTSVTIPDGVSSIGGAAFYGCSSLTSVTIPDGVTSIREYAFSGCSSLTDLTIPDGVTSIKKYAFENCTGLTTVQFLGDGITGTDNIFNNAVTAYYPNGNTTWTQEIRDSYGSLVTWVEACTNGTTHTEVIDEAKAPTCTEPGLTKGSHCSVCGTVLVAQEEIPTTSHTEETIPGKDATCTETGLTDGKKCSVCGRILKKQTVIPAGHQFDESNKCTVCGVIGGKWGDQGTWELVDGCLTIQGAAMFDQLCPALDDAPWGIYSEDICEIVIGNNVGICENAFANLANLEAVTIAAIDGIRDNAFAGCGKLNTITFTEEVPFAISQTAFTGVTATAHYNVKYNTRLYINLQNYGGNLTWVEHGDNAKRIEIILYGSSGGVGSFVVQTYPNKTTADCEFTLSAEGVIELTSQYFRGATFRELSPGEVTVTARDKSTGLTASCTIFVADTQPKDIDCPYEEEILIDGTIIRREYRFIPQTTGYYASYNSYMGEAGGITVTQGDSWVDRVSSQYIPSDGEYGVYYLTAGETYSISLECDSWYYGTYATFRWTQPETQVTSVFFEEEEFHFDLAPGTQDQSAWASAYVTPGECLGKLTWSIGDSTVAEIQSSDGNNCCLTLKKAGTTTLTASCGDKSASVPLVVHSPVELKLNQTAQLNHYKNTYNRMVQFTAEEDGQYVFTVQGASSVSIDGQMQYPNGYGTDGNTYFTKVSAGQTVVLRLGLHEDSSAAVSVAKAESKPDSMELICLSNNQHKVSFGVSFSPATSMDKIVSWTVSDPDLLGELSTYDSSNSKQSYIPYAKGQVTVTATSASGLTASCTLTVGRCFDGHTNASQDIAATCTTGGFTINTCSVCGEITITSRVGALGHDLTHYDAQAATCTEDGWNAYDDCSRCDYTTYEEIPATGHTLSHVNGSPATCKEAGVKEHYHCSNCGKDFEDENGTTELTDTSIPAKDHTEETIPGKAATCTEPGLTDGKKCSVCGEILEEQQVIPASHNFVDGVCSKCGAITGICGANGDNLTYVLTTDGKLTISGSGKMADYSESSPAPWYSERARITSVALTDGVTSIGYSAFFGCSSLTSVTIPEGVTTIGGRAFENCSGLTSVTIPDGVSSIGYSAFENCSGLTSVTIPDGVSSIENGTFSGCSGLTSVTIPDGVSSIGERAFYGCSGLTSVTIPKGVTSIGGYAFRNCSGLTSVTIPEGVTSIRMSAFEGCSSLTSVTIPKGVTSIGSSAFEGCSSLTSVTIPEGVTSIEERSFSGCSGLTSVTIPDSVTSIGSYAFYGCSSLTSVTIPEGVTAIRSSAFSGCSKLTSVTIPDGVTSIESSTFSGCSGLTSVTIPKGVTAIGNNAFYKCSSLTSVTIPDGVTAIGSGTFHSCSSLTSVTIPKSVTSIGDQAFYSCSSLTNLTIPDSVTSIGGSAFHSCSSLTSVTIPKGVSSIEYLTFCGCSSLTSVTISEGVSSIERGSFSGCSSLTTVQFLGDGFTGADNIFMYPVTAYYPHGNTTWTQEIRDSFTSRVTWKEACIGALEHTEITDEAKAPTCTETGLTEGSHCSVCGTVLVAQEEISATGHTLTMVEGKEATCTEAGVKAHYHCSVCDKDFEDEDGTTELTDTSIPAEGHSLAKVERVEPTCTEDGVKAHYHCSVCDKNFEDENGTKEMTDTSIPTVEHEWGEWEVTTPATPEAEGVETRKCASCQQEETRPLAYTGNRVELAGTGLENEQVVWIDGVAVPVQKDGSGNSYVTLPENSSSILVTYSFNTGSGDRHTQYPTGMKVYRVEKTDSGLTVAHLPELDNLLQYSGCSIRIVGVKGIRMITSISKSTRSALMGDGLAGYKLVEYGTALCRASALEGGAPMVLGTPGVKSNYAYKRGVADPIFKDTGSLIQYTNVLVGFTDEDCKEDIAMRPYIILEDEKGETVTLYGGTVYRSIGYIAYQNRSAFAPGTAAYDYVWNIIHYVYGDQYDADYKG